MIAAHPDDEDSALLAELALRQGVRTIYLSLTRGEGGQNRLGSEKGISLGLVRTGELLAARRLDGAEQLLGPFIDFGFSKSAQEGFDRWKRADVERVIAQAIRLTRPDVVISIWNGTKSDGHGHHQACGLAVKEAFKKAGDRTAFPDLLKKGYRPWKSRALYIRERKRELSPAHQAHRISVPVGKLDSVLGRSPLQIALEGRSLHRSQDMGALQPKGSQYEVYYRWIAGEPFFRQLQKETLFFNFKSDLPRIGKWEYSKVLPGIYLKELTDEYSQLEKYLTQAWSLYHPEKNTISLNMITLSLKLIEGIEGKWNRLEKLKIKIDREAREMIFAFKDELQLLKERVIGVWLNLKGISFDWVIENTPLVEDQDTISKLTVFNRSDNPLTWSDLHFDQAQSVNLSYKKYLKFPLDIPPYGEESSSLQLVIDRDPLFGLRGSPPWLQKPFSPGKYFDSEAEVQLFPESGSDSLARAWIEITDPKSKLIVEAPCHLEDRILDPGRGELRFWPRCLPKLEVMVDPKLQVFPQNSVDRARVSVQVRLNDNKSQEIEVVLEDIEGNKFMVLEKRTLKPIMGLAREDWSVEIPLSRIQSNQASSFIVKARLVSDPASESYSYSMGSVEYSHIERFQEPRLAGTKIVVVDAEVSRNLKIGYLPGAGDEIAQGLISLGLSPKTLDVKDLQFSDLSSFDTIVVGIRALEVRKELIDLRGRLWEYVKKGGHLLVQYHKPRQDGPQRFVPFEGVTMTRPAERVTYEDAEIEFLLPNHPILNQPNKLTEEDFDGWVQERGLYFLSTWPEGLQPILSSHDPGEPARKGGLLDGRLGKGTYRYCAYALFRQIPAGVPGAYRLLANLVTPPKG